MADNEGKKATRDGFGDQLVESGARNERLAVLCADLTEATRADKFANVFPDRYLDVGIAEANMIGIAAGIAAHGERVVCSSFASFITGRYDQIRCSIAYPNVPVVIVGTHAGMAIGRDGVTQMGTEDMALMRALPNMAVYQPATYGEARAITRRLCEDALDHPAYLRLCRQPVDEIYRGNVVYDGSIAKIDGWEYGQDSDCKVFASGGMVGIAVGCCEKLRQLDKKVDVYNINTVKPLDRDGLIRFIAGARKIVTIEDHSVIGGIGSAVLEAIGDEGRRPVLRIGIKDVFPESGKPEHLYEKYGLSEAKIIDRMLSWM